MKLQALALSLLVSLGLATPARRDVNPSVYTLRLTSPEPHFDGIYLTTTPLSSSLSAPSGLTPTQTQSTTDNSDTNNNNNNNNDTQLGVYTDAHTPQLYYHAVTDPATGLSSLRDARSGATLAVLGSNGLLTLASLADPAAFAQGVPEGVTVDWTSFRLVTGHQEGGQELQYVGADGGNGKGVNEVANGGRWAAFPNTAAAAVEKRVGEKRAEGGWNVVWKGAEAWTTDDYMPVQVVYELVTSD